MANDFALLLVLIGSAGRSYAATDPSRVDAIFEGQAVFTVTRPVSPPDARVQIDVKEFGASMGDPASVLERHGLSVDGSVQVTPRGEVAYDLGGARKSAYRDLELTIIGSPVKACVDHGFSRCGGLKTAVTAGQPARVSARDLVPDFMNRAVDGGLTGPNADQANCHDAALNVFTTDVFLGQIPGMIMTAVLGSFFRPLRAGESLKFGDVLVISKIGPGYDPSHSAVYIGGDILFNKAGPNIEIAGRPASGRKPYAYERLESVIEPYSHSEAYAKPFFATFYRRADAAPLDWRKIFGVGW